MRADAAGLLARQLTGRRVGRLSGPLFFSWAESRLFLIHLPLWRLVGHLAADRIGILQKPPAFPFFGSLQS
jgi:hypothetical protein